LLPTSRVQGPSRVRAICDNRLIRSTPKRFGMVNYIQTIHEEHAPQFKEAENEMCVYIMRLKADGTPVDLDIERGITLEEGEKLVIAGREHR
jgi:hypothetical protein